jgi:tRNA threonylcarbamoyladenosine biosynthesis protein TsaE
MAAGLGADPDNVSSPTFVLIQQYKGRIPLVHVDLYRLESGAAVDDLGLEEMASGAVVAIEWAERLPRPLDGSVSVKIEDLGGNSRRIAVLR